jgi:predicted lipoprotein with Yx(FWY)xxD motif
MTRAFVSRQAFRHRRMLLVLPVAAAAASALAACSSSGTSSTAAHASGASTTSAAATAIGLKTAKVGGTTVLTNGKGFTVYSFAPDTSTKSNCNGACAKAWPPVKPTTISAVKAPFSTIKRSDGSTQVTFQGHPLYTFVGDKSPGQAKGNGVNAFGGLWHVAPTSGTAAPAANSSSISGGSGY